MDDVMSRLAARIDANPVYRLLGVELDGAGDGWATLSLTCDERHTNVDKVIHGGVLALLADTAMGMAVRTQIDSQWPNKTLTISMEYVLGALVGERVTARATVDIATSRFRWANVDLTTERGCAAQARSLNLVEPPHRAR